MSVGEYELPVNLVLLAVRLSCCLDCYFLALSTHLPCHYPSGAILRVHIRPESRVQNPSQTWILDSSLCQWNLDSGFQSLVGFRIL